jgi:hypothetical protein
MTERWLASMRPFHHEEVTVWTQLCSLIRAGTPEAAESAAPQKKEPAKLTLVAIT